MQRIITFIPAIPQMPRLIRTAGYARTSVDKDAMLHSLSAQVSYYNDYIGRRRDWEFVGVFVDEAMTGTKNTRGGFQDMLTACREGKIDQIITKSISRFARNTVTLLETIRELRSLGIDVYFERERIHSMSSDGELLLTLLASFAQEESKSASDNMKWYIRKKFAEGELVNLRFMYGYAVKRGSIEIVEKEAAIVRAIFHMYIHDDLGGQSIANCLRERGVPTLRGASWTQQRITDILRNEKYTGNALLQKKFVVDHLSKKEVTNKGELPMYYAEGTHPAIISQELFDEAQRIREERRLKFNVRQIPPAKYPFSGMVICGCCGNRYKRKTTHGKVAWNCATYLTVGRDACAAKQIPEDTLYRETAAALGLDSFDERVFRSEITSITVPEFNHIVFNFRDGHSVTRIWKNRSRSESWSDEMRQAARDLQTPELREASRQRMNLINEGRRLRNASTGKGGHSHTAEN